MAFTRHLLKSFAYTSTIASFGLGSGSAIAREAWPSQVKVEGVVMREALPKSFAQMTKRDPFAFAIRLRDNGRFSFSHSIQPLLASADCAFELRGKGGVYPCVASRYALVSEENGKPYTVVPMYLKTTKRMEPGVYRLVAQNMGQGLHWIVPEQVKAVFSGAKPISARPILAMPMRGRPIPAMRRFVAY